MRTSEFTAAQVRTETGIRVRWPGILRGMIPIAAGLLFWAISLQWINPNQMNDLGLISVLPLAYYLALVTLSIGFSIANSKASTTLGVRLLYIAALILIIHGTPQIVYGTLRYSWTWKHVGIIDYIIRHGSVDPTIAYLNVYHNWPGFFSLGALLTQVAGFQSALSFAGWGPVAFNLLDLGAIVMILRTLTDDSRLIWLGVWFFFLGNWVGQDYFSPQAMAYFLYLVILGIGLNWLRATKIPSRESIQRWLRFKWATSLVSWIFSHTAPLSVNEVTPRQRFGLMVVIILAVFAIVSSHQLTPFMLILALTALVLFGVIRTPSLPVLAGVLTTFWVLFIAVAFMQGNIGWIVKSIGSLLSNFNGNLINLSKASHDQVIIANIDRALTGLIGVLAVLGFLRRIRQGKWDIPAGILILTPFPMLVATAYGGEIVFRVYYFALPFLAFFAAAFFYTNLKSATWRTSATTGAMSVLLITGLLFGYYGKERMNYFSPAEVDAANYLLQTAPHGALVADVVWDWPLQFKNYEYYSYMSIVSLPQKEQNQVLQDPVAGLVQQMKGNPAAYLVITRSQIARVEMTGLLPAGSITRIENALAQSTYFKVVYQNSDAVIFELVNPSGGLP